LFGIIIDTFGELRTKGEATQEDMDNKCFICGVDRGEFDRNASVDFEYHVTVEHNLWNYLAFNMNLRCKKQTEYTGPEQYVYEMIQKKDWTFIPHLQALSFKDENASEDQHSQILLLFKEIEKVTAVMKKMEKKGAGVIVPRVEEGSTMKQTRLLKLSSTYVQKADAVMPKAGDQPQWRGRSSYFRDIWESWYGDIATGLEYIPLAKKAQ